MGDVGILRTTIGVESHQRRGDVHELPETLVGYRERVVHSLPARIPAIR